MTFFSRLFNTAGFVTSGLLLTFGHGAYAADCLVGVSVSKSSAIIAYNPFVSGEQSSEPFQVTFERRPSNSVLRVSSVDFQFIDTDSPSGAARIGQSDLTGVGITGGSTQILGGGTSDFSASRPFLNVDFSGNSPSATSSNMRLRIPGGRDTPAGYEAEQVSLAYRCNFSDGTKAEGTRNSALTIGANVQFLVRATTVGGSDSTTLNFDPVNQQVIGGLAVRSTGPFSVSAVSQNQFVLRPNGNQGASPLPSDQIFPYNFHIAGKLMNASGAKKLCPRTGTAGQILRVRARGSVDALVGQLRSGGYSDVLTVTISPETASVSGSSCAVP
jgi:hypothetical protein